MPTVPILRGPQVAPTVQGVTPLRQPDIQNAGPQQMQQFGQALAGAGSQAAGIIERELQQQTADRIQAGMNALVERVQELTFGEQGFSFIRGEAALKPDSQGRGLEDAFTERLRETITNVSSGLSGERAKREFQFQAEQLLTKFRGDVAKHAGGETLTFRLSTHEGTKELAQRQLALQSSDPQAVQQGRGAIAFAVSEMGRLKGHAPQQIQADTIAALSVGHSLALRNSVDAGRLDFARSYLETYGNELTPQARAEAQRVLDIGTAEAKAQDVAGSLFSKHGGDSAAALAEARATLQGKDEDAVVQRIKVLDAEGQAFRSRSEREAYDSGRLLVAQGRPVPPSLLARMGEGHAAAIVEARTARARAAAAEAAGRSTKTDWQLYTQLRQQAADDPVKFAGTDLSRYLDRLGGGQIEQLLDIQAALAKDSRKAPSDPKVHSHFTITQLVNSAAERLRIKSDDKGKLQDYVQRRVIAESQGGTKQVQDERVQQIVDEAVLEMPGTWSMWTLGLGSNQRRFESAAGSAPTAPQDAAPPVRVQTDADYLALPPGTRFVTPDGRTGTKR